MEIDTSKVSQEYIDAVTALADKKENRRFLNDSSEHAKLLANLMIGRKTDSDDCVIYSGSLPLSCFKDAIIAAHGKIRVLVDDEANIEALEKEIPDFEHKLEIRKIAQRHASQINHFFVCGSAFRYEMNHSHATAISNFNEPEVTNSLTTSFNTMWDGSSAV